MKWFRDNIRHGAKLALFALAVQIVLSLGHMHLDRAEAAPSVGQTATLQAPPPLIDPHAHHATDPCAICAVIAMASTALFAAPPLLSLPEAAGFVYRATQAEFGHLDALSGAAQPRGPPRS